MKITKLTTWRLPPRWMFLKIETDEGKVGWGEPIGEGRARTVAGYVPRRLLSRRTDPDERDRRY